MILTIILLSIIAVLLILLMCTNSAETLLKAEIEKLHNYYENIIKTQSDYHKYAMDNMIMQIKELEDKIKEYESIDNKIESNTLGWVLPPNEPNIGDKIRVFYNDYQCYYEGIYKGGWRILISTNCYCCDFDKWMLIEPYNKIKSELINN